MLDIVTLHARRSGREIVKRIVLLREEQRLPKRPDVLVTTTLVSTPVTTMPVSTTVQVTMVPTMSLTLPVLIPLSLGLGAEGGIFRQSQEQSQGYEWSMVDTTTQDAMDGTPGPTRVSCYEYQPPHETGAHPWHKDEEKGWEEHLTRME
ncbi:UNVERIFIED_CONTAM: hypothetical protein K2H54_057569 [Gekko kuhli]